MSLTAGIGFGNGGDRKYWVHDKFTVATDTLLDSHVPTEQSLGGETYTKIGAGTGVITVSAATGRAENTSGNWEGYAFDFGVLVPRQEIVTSSAGSTGIQAGGLITRLDEFWAGGTYCYINIAADGTAEIDLRNWDTQAPLATAVSLTGSYSGKELTLVMEDDGTTITCYTLEEPSIVISAAAVGLVTNTGAGVYFEGPQWEYLDNYKVSI